MTPHLNEEQVASYRSRSLPGDELIRASHHLTECEACRQLVSSPGDLYTGVEALRVILGAEGAHPPHVNYDEIAAYVDQHLTGDDRAEIEMHARQCSSCAAELAQLQSLRRELEVRPTSPAWLDRIGTLWRETFAWKGAFALAGALACAVLVLVLVRNPAPRTAGQRAGTPPPASQFAGIHDGKRVIKIAPLGTVSGLDDLPASLRNFLAQAITTQQIDTPAVLADLSGKNGVLLGASVASPTVDLLTPLGIVVESQTPTLRWKPVAGAEYRVSMFSQNYDEVAASRWTRNAEWQVEKPLRRGARYFWQLNVRRNGAEFTVPTPPLPEARFEILDAAGEAELSQIKAGSPDSHLLLGLSYARLGALDDAERELRMAREQNPESPTVSALLASVEHLRTRQP